MEKIILYEYVKKIPFSSLRKWSAIEFKGIGTIVVGAAEKIISGELPEDIHELMLQGMRAIAIGYTEKTVDDKEELPRLQPLMAIIYQIQLEIILKKH